MEETLEDTSMFHQQQLEQEEWEMLQLHKDKQVKSMTDKEFFEWIESVEEEKANV